MSHRANQKKYKKYSGFQKFSANCIGCGERTKVTSQHIADPYCPKCLKSKQQQLPSNVKTAIATERGGKFPVTLTDPGQVKQALDSVGDAFRGGSSGINLMLTEHEENGRDAIEDLIKILNLQNYPGKILIIIDEKDQKIYVIDNGTGVIDPVHVMVNPLKSRKTGLTHQTGTFGRGLQGFRGFNNTLTYISLRSEVSDEEWKDKVSKEKLDLAKKKGISGKCIKLSLTKENVCEVISQGKTFRKVVPWEQDENGEIKVPPRHKLIQSAVETIYEPVDVKEFKKYSKSETGTVVIFSDWLPGEFDELLRDKNKTIDRIRHHFQVVIENKTIAISIGDSLNGSTTQISPRKWEAPNENGVMESLDAYEIEDRQIINPYTKEVIGTLEVNLFKANPNYKSAFKAPYLLVGDRPLGNSTLHDMEHFQNHKILKSPFVTGFVRANFLKPDTLRLSPMPGEALKQFNDHMDQIIVNELTPQIQEQSAGWRVKDMDEENEKARLEVQTFVKDENVPLDLLDNNELGGLITGQQKGDDKTERISNESGKENKGRITKDGKIKTVITYQKNKIKNRVSKLWALSQFHYKPKRVIRTEVTIPSKDGKSTKKVLLNPNLDSKGGRKRVRSLVGPGLDTYRGKYDAGPDGKPILSKWDAGEYKVLVNEKNEICEIYEDDRQNGRYHSDVYSPKQRQLMQERYLWHLIQECAKKDKDGNDLTPEAKTVLFWKLKYKFFLKK